MMNITILALSFWSLLAVAGVVAVASVIGTYLFLRNNPRKKTAIDEIVDEVKRRGID